MTTDGRWTDVCLTADILVADETAFADSIACDLRAPNFSSHRGSAEVALSPAPRGVGAQTRLAYSTTPVGFARSSR